MLVADNKMNDQLAADPLSYEYQSYHFNHLQHLNSETYNFEVKLEPIIAPYPNNYRLDPPNYPNQDNQPQSAHENQNVNESNIIKEKSSTKGKKVTKGKSVSKKKQPKHESLTITGDSKNNDGEVKSETKEGVVTENQTDVKVEKKSRTKGHKSSYFSEKIQDGFPFYGCSVCNISFTALPELRSHVDTHSDRPTSYDLKVKNMMRRKQQKKEKKKEKRKKKGVKIKEELEIEIKPEDGYIGNEKATEFDNKDFNEEFLKQLDIKNKNNDGTDSIEKETKVPEKGEVEGGNGNTDDKSVASAEKESLCKETEAKADNLERIFKCFACQKQFSLGYYLKLHVRSHTDEKPYQCPDCGERFITASKLGRHKKRVHLSIKYKCRVCFRIFSRWDNLTVHFDRIHPDDKLEGEVYDYYAILPYIKELEEQLEKEKAEKIKLEEDMKPKIEDPWPLEDSGVDQAGEKYKEESKRVFPVAVTEGDTKAEVLDAAMPSSRHEIMIEDVKIKQEPEDSEAHMEYELVHDPGDGDIKNDTDDDDDDDKAADGDGLVKNEDSDEDYFPSNTWATKPDVELRTLDYDITPSEPKRRRKRGKDEPKVQLKCDICNKNISSRTYLRIHMRTHTGEKPHRCYVCDKGFITSGKMHRHVLIHPEAWIDGTDMNIKQEVEIKKEKSENDDDTNKIEAAKDKFRKKRKNKGEKLVLSGKRREVRHYSFVCEFCHKRFLHKETLQVHRKSHDNEVMVLKCHFCLEVCENEELLKIHEATHTGPKPYFCTICLKNYKKRETMVWHRKSHKPEKTFTCDICSKSFNAQCKLQRHIVSHRTDKFFLRYECPVCAHMFNTKYHVQMHLNTHMKEGLIQEENRNEIIAMVLQNARKIPKHNDANSSTLTDIMPADERSRICNICGQVFQHFYYLEEHLKSHASKIALEDQSKDEERKYICEICNKGFKLHYYLKLHSFTHTKEKPFVCQQCGKGFITRGKLKRHLETHTGIKKFQCHICYKFFTRPSYLRIHVRTIHGTQDYNFSSASVVGKQYAQTPLNSAVSSDYVQYSPGS